MSETIARLKRAGIKVIIMTRRNKKSIHWVDNAIGTGKPSEDNICQLNLLEGLSSEGQQNSLLRLMKSDQIIFGTNACPRLKILLYNTLNSLVIVSWSFLGKTT